MEGSRGRPPERPETDAFARTEVVGSSPEVDTDPFARTALVGSSPPDLGTPVEPLAETSVDTNPSSRRDGLVERLRDGTKVDRFTVLDVLGAGGMGVVLAAWDPKLDRKVAIKMLHDDVSVGHGPRLEREAKAMAQLSHPNVVTVHETGSFEGRLYIAMEYVEGATFSDWLRGGARTRWEIVDLLIQAGRGLAAAHQVGLVHRDFKPDNVLVGRDGRVRVSDFGR
jgi:serine/threonine protein kinase